MKSVVLKAKGSKGGAGPVLVDLPSPELGEGDLLVDLKACGICGTDIEKAKGQYTASAPVLGHEAVGIVAEVGDRVSAFKRGDRVFPHHHAPCGECALCLGQSQTMCADYRKSNLDPGGFSESFRVPQWNVERGAVLKLPDSISFELASLTEPLACCIRAMDRAGARSGGKALVVGAGPVGLANALVLRSRGFDVWLSDVNKLRVEFAKSLGLGRVFDASSEDVPGQVRSGGEGVDLAVIASGSPKAVSQGVRSVRKGGRVSLFGVPVEGSRFEQSLSDLYNSEISVIPSYGATEVETAEALKILEGDRLGLGRLITHRFGLGEFAQAMGVAERGEGCKVVVVP
ncbi:MAG: alcohol dehydrogenase catalytic domain-containing protein [archaeon]|nr:MAG: alcohol dehydrogenase catalytic domain-containing protein [archaeon]